MLSWILYCPHCSNKFEYEEKKGDTVNISCPHCGKAAAKKDYSAMVYCPHCREELAVPVELVEQPNDLICPQCNQQFNTASIAKVNQLQSEAEDSEDAKEGSLLSEGDLFDKYRIIRLLGRGGMAEVYLAEHLMLHKQCALKLMTMTDSSNVAAKRFVREAMLSYKIDNPHVVKVFDVGSDMKTGMLFISMEFVEGKSLSDLMAQKTFSEAMLWDTLHEIGDALLALSKEKIVHRDLKPSNIMLNKDGVMKLMDLGIAKSENKGSQEALTLTMAQSVIGTPGYASPEQCQSSHEVDARSDIFSLGATLYSLATGKIPFVGNSAIDIILHTVQDEPEPLAKLRPDLSPKLVQLIELMMKKKPEDRPVDAAGLLELADGKKKKVSVFQRMLPKLKQLRENYYISPRKIRRFAIIASVIVIGIIGIWLLFAITASPAEKKKGSPEQKKITSVSSKKSPAEQMKEAIKAGDQELLAEALKNGADPLYDDPQEGNAIQQACRAKQVKCVKFLLKKGYSANNYLSRGFSDKAEFPLDIAFRSRSLPIFRLLLAHNGDFSKELPDRSGELSPLFVRIIRYFAQTPHEAIPYLEEMLRSGWNINSADASGKTAVWICCEFCPGPQSLMEYLCSRNAQLDFYVSGVSPKSRFGSKTELKRFFEPENKEEKLFLKQLADYCGKQEQKFEQKKKKLSEDFLARQTWEEWKKNISSAQEIKKDQKRKSIDQAKSIQLKRDLEEAMAARKNMEYSNNDLLLFKRSSALLESGDIDPDMEILDAGTQWRSRSLLHWAVAGRLVPAGLWIPALLHAGATPAKIRFEELPPESAGNLAKILPDYYGDLSALCTPLMVAQLLEIPDFSTPLRIGVKRNLKPFIQLFRLHPECSLWSEKFNGRTLLHYAAEENSEELAKMLIATGNADKNAVDALGFTAYYRVLLCGNQKLADLFQLCNLNGPLNGAQIDQIEFHKALRSGRVRKVNTLLEKGVNPLLPVRNQLNAVQYAVNRKFIKILTALLKAHADPNKFVELGYPMVSNPLDIALTRNSQECFDLLLHYRADFKKELHVFHLGRGTIGQKIVEVCKNDPGKAQPYFTILKKYGWNSNLGDQFGRNTFWSSCAYTKNAVLIGFLASNGGNWDQPCFDFTPRALVLKSPALAKEVFAAPPKEKKKSKLQTDIIEKFQNSNPINKMNKELEK